MGHREQSQSDILRAALLPDTQVRIGETVLTPDARDNSVTVAYHLAPFDDDETPVSVPTWRDQSQDSSSD